LTFEVTAGKLGAVPRFRYAQLCPVARAVEILGERWTLLIGRELLIGPQRFSDLQRRLPGLSSSVLAERLASLEERGLVARRSLPPPAPATLYELTEAGRALRPVVYALARFGVRFMQRPKPGDHSEPDWLVLGLDVFARRGPTPARVFSLRLPGPTGEVPIHVTGGPQGTVVRRGEAPADAVVHAAPAAVLGLASGGLEPAAAAQAGTIRVSGDAAALRELPALFDFFDLGSGSGPGGSGSSHPQ
jgi:DNA-binding HxlR family transcriptional regulator